MRLAGLCLAIVLAAPAPAWAVGCVRATCSSTDDARGPYLAAGAWRLTQGYRYFQSHRHFIGDVEQTQRAAAGTEVMNTVHFFDEQVGYGLTDRVALDLVLPLQLASRSTPYAGGRDVARADGAGDLQALVRAWWVDPAVMAPWNVELGVGVKLPTGADALLAPRHRDTAVVSVPVDPSLQPGDGGWGGVAQLAGFWAPSARGSAYLEGTYVLGPEGTNGVVGPDGTAVSIADQYVVRAGVACPLPAGFGVSFGYRLEGVPVADLLGGSDGFRRPGVAVSFDPGVTYAVGTTSVALNVAMPFYRNRWASLAESKAGAPGDAAFADWLLGVQLVQTFGGSSTSSNRP